MSRACAKFFVCKTVIFQMNEWEVGKFCLYAPLVPTCVQAECRSYPTVNIWGKFKLLPQTFFFSWEEHLLVRQFYSFSIRIRFGSSSKLFLKFDSGKKIQLSNIAMTIYLYLGLQEGRTGTSKTNTFHHLFLWVILPSWIRIRIQSTKIYADPDPSSKQSQ